MTSSKTPRPSKTAEGWIRFVSPGYSALLATGLMLPIGGAIVRAVVLATSNITDWARLAGTLPPTELAALGFLPVTLMGLLVVYVWLLGAMGRRGWLFSGAGDARRSDFRVVLVVALGLLLAVPAFARLGGGPFAVAGSGLAAIAFWLGSRESKGPVRGPRLAVLLVLMYGLASLAFGVRGHLGPTITVFTTAPGVQLGPAIRLAEDETWLYVAWCDNRAAATAIAKAEITSMAWAVGPATQAWDPLSLDDLIRRFTAPVGAYAACP